MKKLYYSTFILIILFSSCGGEKIDNSFNDGFNRQELLSFVTDSIIIPSHTNLSTKLNKLSESINSFCENTNENELDNVRNDWIDAYLNWQYVEMFNIGKAEEIYYWQRMNTYPCNESIINSNIDQQNYDFSSSNYSSFTSQGFPTMGYMLYGLGGDSTQVLSHFTGTNMNKYKLYLQALVSEMIDNTNDVNLFWNNNRSDFISSSGNTASSSLNMLANDFIYYYEKGFRAHKIGIPAGHYSSAPYPQNVESYYKRDLCKSLTLNSLQACKSFFIGESFNSSNTGVSLKDYLEYLPEFNDLSNLIISHLDIAKEKILLLEDDFVYQINTNNMMMLSAFDAIQEVVVMLKTEMLSGIGIQVDYLDADGD